MEFPRNPIIQDGIVHPKKHIGENFTLDYTHIPLDQSAHYLLSNFQKIFLFFSVGTYVFLLFVNWHMTIMVSIVCVSIIYFVDLFFNFYLIYLSLTKKNEVKISNKTCDESTFPWPDYTVICPLYKELAVLPQFIDAMSRLNYPKDKLQILLLLEEDDISTLEYVKNNTLPFFFEVVVVPESLPRTKPKAMNHSLYGMRGEYCVIYDAEDIPDEYQLKKSVLGFQTMPANTICLQAKLNFYNPHQNILTKGFTAEYSLWFDLVLPGLQSLQAPIPLGGTSNHFKTAVLQKLGGWDPFNVTEDCDLGMRLFKKGYQTAVLDSVTLEEANSNAFNWFTQRTRWIKGYIQTYIVHTRNPLQLHRWHSLAGLFLFQTIVGTKVFAMLLNPLMWALTISYFVFRSTIGPTIESFYPPAILYSAVITLVFGNFLQIIYYMIGSYKKKYYGLLKYALIVPLYWFGISMAAWKALFETFLRPHYWSKTEHGLHLQNTKALSQSEASIGRDLFQPQTV